MFQDVIIREHDCGTNDRIVQTIHDHNEVIEFV